MGFDLARGALDKAQIALGRIYGIADGLEAIHPAKAGDIRQHASVIAAHFADRTDDAIGSGVKALEWQESAEGEWRADIYRVRCDIADEPPLWVVSGWAVGTNPYSTLNEAKAAAQADFERRVLSCLSTHTAANARPSDDRLWDQTLTERDNYHDAADKLAEAIGELLGVNVGEHSSAHSPWETALEHAGQAVRNRDLSTHTAAEAVPVGEAVAWRCFHCDDVFASEHDARLHFGREEGATPACQIKGSENGLVAALRQAENEASEAWMAIHNETTDAARAYQAQAARHRQQLTTIEQVGYDRGLADAKAHPETLGLYARPVEEPVEVERLTRERDAARAREVERAEKYGERIDGLCRELAETRERLEKVEAAGEPIAAYTRLSGFERLPADHAVTQGSRLAARQLTAGDLRQFAAALTGDAQEAGK